MLRHVIGLFFFGLLGLCFTVVAISALGLNVVDLSQEGDRTAIIEIFTLAGVCLWICFMTQNRKKKRAFKKLLNPMQVFSGRQH